MKRFIHLISVFFICFNFGFGQVLRFENEILNFEKRDEFKKPPTQANLFVGSSSIRLWHSIDADFEGFSIINRGFGGSTLADLDLLVHRIITKYQPAKIFIYSGENDIADGATAEETFDRFKKVYSKIRVTMPEVKIVFISIKPSIARQAQFETQSKANMLIKSFLEKETNTEYANIANKMLMKKKPNPSLFIADKLHMNQKGYEIWTKKLKRYLVR
jgi:lysophospholipase L1-like esterase